MITPNLTVRLRYRNWKGVVKTYLILPSGLWYGSTEYHPRRQWLLSAIDLDDGESKNFAVKDVLDWTPMEES